MRQSLSVAAGPAAACTTLPMRGSPSSRIPNPMGIVDFGRWKALQERYFWSRARRRTAAATSGGSSSTSSMVRPGRRNRTAAPCGCSRNSSTLHDRRVVEDEQPTFVPGPGLRADPQRAVAIRHYQAQVSAIDGRDPALMGSDVSAGNHAGEARGREARDLTQRVCSARAVRQCRVDAGAERDESVDAPASSVHLALHPGLERFVAQHQTLRPDVSPGPAKTGQERELVIVHEHAESPSAVGARRTAGVGRHHSRAGQYRTVRAFLRP